MGRRATGTGKFVKNNIRALRLKAGMTATELCKRAGISTSQLSRLELQRRRFSLDIADKLAAALGVTRAAITEDVNMDPVMMRVTVTGQLQDGVFTETSEWPIEDCYEVSVRDPDRFVGIQRHASELVGSSMNQRFPEGTIVVWVPFEEIDEPLLPGRFYVLSRKQSDGRREFIVRSHMRDREGNDWFYPESTDPEHQSPIAYDDNVMTVVGRVTDTVAQHL